MVEAGADGIELGVPFSDPLADGATLQRVGNLAIEQGASVEMALDLVRGLRQRSQAPVILMTYYNLLLAYGLERLMVDGTAAGIDGLIVPDLPLEEACPSAADLSRRGPRPGLHAGPDQHRGATCGDGRVRERLHLLCRARGHDRGALRTVERSTRVHDAGPKALPAAAGGRVWDLAARAPGRDARASGWGDRGQRAGGLDRADAGKSAGSGGSGVRRGVEGGEPSVGGRWRLEASMSRRARRAATSQ